MATIASAVSRSPPAWRSILTDDAILPFAWTCTGQMVVLAAGHAHQEHRCCEGQMASVKATVTGEDYHPVRNDLQHRAAQTCSASLASGC